MEGVLVRAKKDGSNITVTVVSDQKGEYSFPGGRLGPCRQADPRPTSRWSKPRTCPTSSPMPNG